MRDIRRTFRLRRTNVTEVDHWAKAANKTANINVQNPLQVGHKTVAMATLVS